MITFTWPEKNQPETFVIKTHKGNTTVVNHYLLNKKEGIYKIYKKETEVRHMKRFDGKKTFIGAFAVFICGGLLALGMIDQKTFEALVAIAGAFTAYGMRKAMK